MRNAALAATFLAGLCCSPALAQDSTQVLRRALGAIAQVATTNPDPIQITIVDVAAWREAYSNDDGPAALSRLTLGRSIDPIQTLGSGTSGQWAEKAGVPLEEISYFAGFGKAPQSVAYWGLRDEAAAGKLIATLKNRGFAQAKGAPAGVVGNSGSAGMDLTQRDVLDPWRGAMGRNYFAVAVGHTVVQAPTPQAMATLAETSPSAADSPVVATALDGLGAVIDPKKAAILQAMVISPAFGLRTGDPARVLTTKPAEAKQALAQEHATSHKGIPPYFGGIIADAQMDGRSAMVVSLTYPDCKAADEAIEGMTALWHESMAEIGKTDIAGRSVAKDGGLCAAVVSFAGASDAKGGNLVLDQTMSRVMRGSFPVLQIAMPGR